MVDWIIFGDDWGAHPSTTQHLIANLPGEDGVVWIDSIGMRPPRLNTNDFNRLLAKIRGGTAAARPAGGMPARKRFARVRPRVAPFHMSRAAQALNRRLIGRDVAAALHSIGAAHPIVLAANPVAVAYVDSLPAAGVGYLRLDDYALLPGVDAGWVRHFEARMFERADAIFATAQLLAPPAPWKAKSHFLPQGVSWEHFAQASLAPSGKPVLGFFGLMAEWLDHELICRLADLKPDWTLHFVGGERFVHPSLRERPNIELSGPVPFSELPHVIADWSAAWIPFRVDELTKAVNPLKLREYLAAGLPTHSTPLPEAQALTSYTDVCITHDANTLSRWLDEIRATDSTEKRALRRGSVAGDSWRARSAQLRETFSREGMQ